MTLFATHTQETSLQPSELEVCLKLLLHEIRQRSVGRSAQLPEPVVQFSAIRTEYWKFDDYMKFLDTTWTATQGAAKKAGYVTGYKFITVEPRGENDPDICLVVYSKNWAALDGGTAKAVAIADQVEGSLAAANKGAVDRGKICGTLGSWTGQELDLK